MRLYVVTDTIENKSILVVANTAKEAKKIGLPELDSNYINTSVNWIRGVEMTNSQEGLYTDYNKALKECWLEWVHTKCPLCGSEDAQIDYDEDEGMFHCRDCSNFFKEL